MNEWKIIWEAYHQDSTIRRLFKNALLHGSKVDKIIIFFASIIFVIGIVAMLFDTKLALFVLVPSELLLLYKLEKLRELLILNQFGDANTSQVPHDDREHKVSRYLMFKRNLRQKSIAKSHVEGCFDLVDTQVDIAQSSGTAFKRFGSFSIGIFVGLLATFWRKLEIEELLSVAVILIIVSSLICFILYLIPSRTEKLKEMKYFMHLCCREYD